MRARARARARARVRVRVRARVRVRVRAGVRVRVRARVRVRVMARVRVHLRAELVAARAELDGVGRLEVDLDLEEWRVLLDRVLGDDEQLRFREHAQEPRGQ